MSDYSHMPCALCGRTGKAQEALAEALDVIEQLKARIKALEEKPSDFHELMRG